VALFKTRYQATVDRQRRSQGLEAALAIHKKGRPMINSISAEKQKLDTVLPLVASHDCSVIALCLGDEGIPQPRRPG